MALSNAFSRQRIPMVDGLTLEDRTRPAQDGDRSVATRLRYYQWPTWTMQRDSMPLHQALPTQARIGRR